MGMPFAACLLMRVRRGWGAVIGSVWLLTAAFACQQRGVRAGVLRSLDTVYLDGIPAQLGASPAGLAVVSVHDAGLDATTTGHHADTSSIAWVDLPLDGDGGLLLRDSVVVPGTVATWERGDAEIVDADEGQLVRVVTCASPACSPTGGATLRMIDFSAASPARRPPRSASPNAAASP